MESAIDEHPQYPRWAESHPRHLRIFVAFIDRDAQRYEEINCHPSTGLMRDAAPSA